MEEKKEPEIRLEVSEDTAKGIEALKQLNDASRNFRHWVMKNLEIKDWVECRDAYIELMKLYRSKLFDVMGVNLVVNEYTLL